MMQTQAYVQQLRVPEDATDDQIKEALNRNCSSQNMEYILRSDQYSRCQARSIDQAQEQIFRSSTEISALKAQ